MKTYTVIGSTGNCGNALIETLLGQPDARINAYCRNKTKLLRQFPNLDVKKCVRVFEGSIDDVNLLRSCIEGSETVFLVLSTNDNIPGCRLGQDTAIFVLHVLRCLRRDQQRIPKLVLLSSSTVDERLSQDVPWFLRQILLLSASNVYKDLEETERMLRAEEDWVTTIYIKPGALSIDQRRGHSLSLDEADSRPLSYLDLAGGMIEAAADEKYHLKNVGVKNVNGGASFPGGTPLCILTGLLRHFFPFLHPYLPRTGP